MYFPVSALLIEFMILSIVNREDSYGYEISCKRCNRYCTLQR